jgi:hypothetical protein
MNVNEMAWQLYLAAVRSGTQSLYSSATYEAHRYRDLAAQFLQELNRLQLEGDK